MILQRKLFYDRTPEMIETAENWKKFKGKVKTGAKKVGSKLAHPVQTSRAIGKSVSGTVKKYKDNPELLKKDAKEKLKKAGKFIKENPQDAVLLGAGEFALPVATKKLVTKFKGPKAGLVAASTVALLPIGEAAVAGRHLFKSNEGKTAVKAVGQHIKGISSDLKKKVRGSKRSE